MKKIIIVGNEGQDGRLLSEIFDPTAYNIKGINKTNFDILNKEKVFDLIETFKPNEIYYFAAVNESSEKSSLVDNYLLCNQVNFIAYTFSRSYFNKTAKM